MELGLLCPRAFWSLLLLAFLLPYMNCIRILSPAQGNETDRLALIAFKDRISEDPFSVFSSWNNSFHFCNWEGITCGRRHRQRVTSLNLVSTRLVGTISPLVANLTFLKSINLSSNSFHGEIPPEIGHLFRLRHLDLSYNRLQGEIPNDLFHCSEIRSILLYQNKLIGRIPPSLFNVSSMVDFSVSLNRLHGNFPTNLGALTLPNLKHLILRGNAFSGPIPVSLLNASRLAEVDFSSNYFRGPMPANLERLQDLRVLRICSNKLGGGEGNDDLSFLSSLTNCSRLEVLDVSANLLRGALPTTIVNLSTHLTQLFLGGSMISGSIPTDISNLFNLNRLAILESSVMGTIPTEIGMLQNLVGLYFSSNKLSGAIPAAIGNLTGLVELTLSENHLQGVIPDSLGNCFNLQMLVLHRNNLKGNIPTEVVSIPSLVRLSIGENSFVGSLPSEVGNLSKLQHLYAANNKLLGELPSAIRNCQSLVILDLSNNLFQGAIPQGLNKLKDIQLLNLSHNNLSGHIPASLEEIPFLEYLDLSYNDLDGEVPHQGIFKNASSFSVLGNKRLYGCIPQLRLPACLKKASKKHGRSISHIVIFSVIGAVLCLILLSGFFVTLYWVRRKASKIPLPASFLESNYLNVSYADLFKATGEFSSDNLIGMGSYGSVYKGILDRDETLVAVKVLNLHQRGASKSFLAECEALRNVRHRNLVKIITACSSIDFKGNDFKALVFEYMPNQGLEKWLHPNEHGQYEMQSLNLIRRLDIAIDVASALEYLHHHCGTPVIHRDLKPSNVLLDDDMCAHVGDFGLARFLSNAASNTSQDQTSSTGIEGSVGYIPPEYGMGGKASTSGDVYSYGILLLEMFTGKIPTDDMFKDGLSLHQFVKISLPDRVMEIVDPRLLLEDVQALRNREQQRIAMTKMRESLACMAKIGIACSVESPNERMKMKDVAAEMHAVRDLYLGDGIHRDQQNEERLLGEVSSYLSHYS